MALEKLKINSLLLLQVLPSLLCPPLSKCTTRTLTSPRLSERTLPSWMSPHARDPPRLPSSTLGLNDARFRGRWAGRPRSSETGWNHPTAHGSLPSPNLPIPRPSHRVSAKPREEFEKFWHSSFYRSSAQLWAAPVSSPVSHRPGGAEAKIPAGSCDCGSHVQLSHQWAAAQSATLKGNL